MKKVGIVLMAFAMMGMLGCKEKKNETVACCAAEMSAVQQPKKEKTVVVARVTVKSGREKAFVEIASKLVTATRAEEGCLFYTLYQSTENPSVFIIYEEYKDDAAFEAHAASGHFKAFAEATNEMMEGELQIDRF
ncbi:MAG: antibiotic biosynthesis monooxygenase [Tannerella sp.]|jgi:quinol monooxygenase YgiN|nr:antibiotic biosynthesis monooxygenase [Tannerella sp.]